MEAQLSIPELHADALDLAKDKVSGPDGIPLEFFLQNWDILADTLLKAINEGIADGKLHKRFTEGLIILLAKKGDLRYLFNIRPLTLNVIYKITAKAYQMRLSAILQRFISQQQSAFIPGRTILHSIFFTNEILFEAIKQDDPFLVLKLDVIKAFDKMEWSFLRAVLEKFGFGPLFLRFLDSSQASASSFVLINDRKSSKFQIRRSVRQGCPLSSLLFVIALDALSRIIQRDVDNQIIRGVVMPESQVQSVHNFYADNISLVIEADEDMLSHCTQLFETFGRASGLYCDWNKTQAVYLSDTRMPIFLQLCNWQWETNLTASKYLGIHMASQIAPALTTQCLLNSLEKRLERASKDPASLYARVVIANHFVLSVLWYILSLWVGDIQDLENMDKQIRAFIWAQNGSTRHKVDYDTMLLHRRKGGIGLVSIAQQVLALLGKFIVWALTPGYTPLKAILQKRIESLSYERHSTRDISWAFVPCKTLPADFWLGIYTAWNTSKNCLVQIEPNNIEEWRSLPIWSPHAAHIDKKKARCTTIGSQILRQYGVLDMASITSESGTLNGWGQGITPLLPIISRVPYEKLISNIQSLPMLSPDRDDLQQCYMGDVNSGDSPDILWEFSVRKKDLSIEIRTAAQLGPPAATYRVQLQRVKQLLHDNSLNPPDQLRRFHINVTRNGKHLLGPITDIPSLALQHSWPDGTPFFNTSVSHLRSLQIKSNRQHSAISNWRQNHNWTGSSAHLWKETWHTCRAEAENCFLWQLIYQVPTTRHYRRHYPGVTYADTLCTRCTLTVPEDIKHCIFFCPASQQIWQWTALLLTRLASTQDPQISFTLTHVFLADPIPVHFPKKAWIILRGVVCWTVWKSRDDHYLCGIRWNYRSVVSKCWYRFAIYLRKEWNSILKKVDARLLTLAQATQQMQSNFGINSATYELEGRKLEVATTSPFAL